MASPRSKLVSAFYSGISALCLLAASASAHEGEPHNIPSVNPNPQKLRTGSTHVEVATGRLNVYCLEAPASGFYLYFTATASAPFTLYHSRDKQPILQGGVVTGALDTFPAEPSEPAEGVPPQYVADLQIFLDNPGKSFFCIQSDTAQEVELVVSSESSADPFSGIDDSGTYQTGRKLLPIYRPEPLPGHSTVELRYTVSTHQTRPAVPTSASKLLPEDGIDLPVPTGRFKDYVVMIRKKTEYPLPDGTTKQVLEFARRDYRILNGIPRLVPSDVISGLDLTEPQEFRLTVPARADVRALVVDSWGANAGGNDVAQLEVRSGSDTVLNEDINAGWYDFPVRSTATTYRLRLLKHPEAEYTPTGMGLRFTRRSVSGLADLSVNGPATQPYIVEADFPEDDGEVQDGLVTPGRHRVIRWNGVTENIGGLPAMVPAPDLQPGLFEFHQTHGHFHYLQFMESRLLTLDGKVAARGRKYSFALMDSQAFNPQARDLSDKSMQLLSGYIDWRRMGGSGSAKLLPEAWRKTADAYFPRFLQSSWSTDRFRDFVCALSGLNPQTIDRQEVDAYFNGTNPWGADGGSDWYQRISPGHADVYGSGTPGQMINIDDVPSGHYLLEIMVNPKGTIKEANLSNNKVRLPIYIPPVASF